MKKAIINNLNIAAYIIAAVFGITTLTLAYMVEYSYFVTGLINSVTLLMAISIFNAVITPVLLITIQDTLQK